jgi:small subunit ribosomal protein S6
MRQYETMVLLSPDLEEDAVEERISSFEKHITENGGEILEIDRMGKKRLAYEINDQRHGIYFVVTYKSEDEIIKELERQFTLDENSWRYMTVRMDEALLRKIEKNIKSAAARAEARSNGDGRDDDD